MGLRLPDPLPGLSPLEGLDPTGLYLQMKIPAADIGPKNTRTSGPPLIFSSSHAPAFPYHPSQTPS